MAPVRAPAVPGSRQKTSEQGEDTRLSPPRAGPDRRQPRSALVPCPRAPGRTAAHATDVTGARNAARNEGPLLPSGARVPVGGRRRQGPGSAGGRPAEAVPSRQPSLPPQQDWGAERGGSVSRSVETAVSPEPGGLGGPGRAVVLRWAHSAWRRPASTSFWNQERRNTDEQGRAPGSAPPAVERSRSRGRAASRGAPPLVSAAWPPPGPVPAPRLGPASALRAPDSHRSAGPCCHKPWGLLHDSLTLLPRVSAPSCPGAGGLRPRVRRLSLPEGRCPGRRHLLRPATVLPVHTTAAVTPCESVQ